MTRVIIVWRPPAAAFSVAFEPRGGRLRLTRRNVGSHPESVRVTVMTRDSELESPARHRARRRYYDPGRVARRRAVPVTVTPFWHWQARLRPGTPSRTPSQCHAGSGRPPGPGPARAGTTPISTVTIGWGVLVPRLRAQCSESESLMISVKPLAGLG